MTADPARLGPYRALGFTFDLRIPDPRARAFVAEVLAPLSQPGRAAVGYELVRETHDATWALRRAGDLVLSTSDLADVTRALFTDVNRQLVARSAGHVLIHASAAAAGHRGLIFPAPSGSGKSTLIAGLVRSGLRYLTDEVTAIHPATLRIEAFPKSLSVDPGSWQALADLAPDEDGGLRPSGLDEWHIDPRSIRADAVASWADPAFVVAPTYVAGADTELIAIPRSEAVFRLAENAFNLRVHQRHGLEVLAEVVRRCSCYRLVVGDLDAACALITGLVGEISGHHDEDESWPALV
jgi:hypothetical protein